MSEKILRKISNSSVETEALGIKLAESIKLSPYFCKDWIFISLYGGLGAGKTAFVRGLASVLTPGAQVSSPTYSIINEYHNMPVILAHFDFYRVKNEDDLLSSGFDDYFRPGIIFAAEWSELVSYALPERRYEVKITGSGDSPREITLAAPAGETLIL